MMVTLVTLEGESDCLPLDKPSSDQLEVEGQLSIKLHYVMLFTQKRDLITCSINLLLSLSDLLKESHLTTPKS